MGIKQAKEWSIKSNIFAIESINASAVQLNENELLALLTADWFVLSILREMTSNEVVYSALVS